ncbi:unnamed protein product [Penicillium salamii]|uniref:Zn(2)-C6 fungal-type domain-containing protein n=1 Tax=Penicillium salamii TaxID=1612424 RepID=A0A9W4JYJ1_9EURO|nr:unnamed protein product [Penicillium salamii]CAG8306167.1 unnamed protein product [Penicillium salamii]CAG8378924.1 unnamed protein product [Penicillium salamii]CAG8383209.1 unnamed protein product [Penicillium salamii]CAG8409755.1 unnamed protein product [Penicillium salamii]
MHPAHNYRHSRRSACDRCRGQKLRCERANMNGMSCERCLKAQEICITSVNHPAAVLSSSPGQDVISNQQDGPGFIGRPDPMALLHKSFAPKVGKSVPLSASDMGRHRSKMHSYWNEPADLSPAPGGDLFLPPNEGEFTLSHDPGSLPVPPQLWGDWNPYWALGPQNLASLLDFRSW